jgi:uncharacterized phage infection (PIP) family protein YhgE
MARFQQLADTRAKIAAEEAKAEAEAAGADANAAAELVRMAEVRARAMTPDVLHKQCQEVHEDVVRIVGELSDEELALRLRDLEQALEASEQRRRANAERITRMQEEQAENLADLRRQVRQGENERDRAAMERIDEIDCLRRHLTAVKAASADAETAVHSRRREAESLNTANLEALEELDAKKAQLEHLESVTAKLSQESERLEAKRAALREASVSVAEMLQQGAELAAAEAASLEDPEEDKENCTPGQQPAASTDPMVVMNEMERKLVAMCAQIQQRDAEISELREIVTQECVQRTQMLSTLKRAGIR